MTRSSAAPLAGIKIIALEQAVAMPFCSFMLAEMGADVVKIERPRTGDVIRGWDDVVAGLSAGFVWVNAGKRDITLDVRSPEGRQVVRELAADADVFLENFAPGAAGRLGLADSDLRPGNDRLVYCSISGYGQSGPYRDMKAYDLLVQGESGVLLSNGYPEAPAKVGLPITDLVAGTNAAFAVVSALFEREHTGRGQYLDIAMLESMMPWLGYFPHRWWHDGAEPPRTGMHHQFLCPYGPYLAGDGRYVNLVVASAEDWERFCREVVRRPEWLDDSHMCTIESRSRNREEVERAVADVIARETFEEWAGRLRAANMAFGEVRGIGSVVSHPQLEARRAFVQAESPVGPVPIARLPLAPPERQRRVPALGEHTEEILAELGYDEAAVARMRHVL